MLRTRPYRHKPFALHSACACTRRPASAAHLRAAHASSAQESERPHHQRCAVPLLRRWTRGARRRTWRRRRSATAGSLTSSPPGATRPPRGRPSSRRLARADRIAHSRRRSLQVRGSACALGWRSVPAAGMTWADAWRTSASCQQLSAARPQQLSFVVRQLAARQIHCAVCSRAQLFYVPYVCLWRGPAVMQLLAQCIRQQGVAIGDQRVVTQSVDARTGPAQRRSMKLTAEPRVGGAAQVLAVALVQHEASVPAGAAANSRASISTLTPPCLPRRARRGAQRASC